MLTLRGAKKKKRERERERGGGYLIDFSFKFNEIKFSTVLMNWLIWEKNVHLFL